MKDKKIKKGTSSKEEIAPEVQAVIALALAQALGAEQRGTLTMQRSASIGGSSWAIRSLNMRKTPIVREY